MLLKLVFTFVLCPIESCSCSCGLCSLCCGRAVWGAAQWQPSSYLYTCDSDAVMTTGNSTVSLTRHQPALKGLSFPCWGRWCAKGQLRKPLLTASSTPWADSRAALRGDTRQSRPEGWLTQTWLCRWSVSQDKCGWVCLVRKDQL